jgi:DNA ligase-1
LVNDRLNAGSTSLTICAISLLLSAVLYVTCPDVARAAAAPRLLLAESYSAAIQLDEYWVSEKLDGVRAYWDGEKFLSRSGRRLYSPDWFTRGFPRVVLDGELWMGRNTYERLSGAVRRHIPRDSDWKHIRYMVFDLPGSTSPFTDRYRELLSLASATDNGFLQIVEQRRVAGKTALMKWMDHVIKQGGEGLMLHRGDSLYQAGRSSDLLKLKPFTDAEAMVIGHRPGKGKYEGVMGSLLVETGEGKRFYLGSGFSDLERANPPPLGSVVTYKHYGLTAKGIPRFASFLRVRDEP